MGRREKWETNTNGIPAEGSLYQRKKELMLLLFLTRGSKAQFMAEGRAHKCSKGRLDKATKSEISRKENGLNAEKLKI